MAVRAALHRGAFLLPLLGTALPAHAQLVGGGTGQPLNGNQPVTFQADSVTYDKVKGLVTATGHVEAWQNDHVLRADQVTFDRNTDVAAAYGHVVIAEPDGEVIFAEYAELSQGMKDGVLSGMRALLAQNGRLAANGARRSEGKLNELSRAVYSTCNVCALDPDRAPLWQLRASHVTQDLENKRIEYTDAYLDFFGFPIFYFPFFAHADPSVKRQSGLLVPSIGLADKHLGASVTIPYYVVLDGQSDITLTPTLTTATGPQLEADYRRSFNFGTIRLDGAVAYDQDKPQGFLFAHGAFTYDDTWRYGFDINLGSSIDYLRDFRVPGYGANALTSSAFIEGFGVGSYTKLDVRTYQGLNSSVVQSQIPYVLPRYEYSFFGTPDGWGGRTSFDVESFNVLREEGTNDQRLGARISWDRPFAGALGDRWLLTLQGTGAVYNANRLDGQPDYAIDSSATAGHAQAQVALRLNWPFFRDAGRLGSQIVEPIVQVIAAPNAGNSRNDRLPNEDSLDYEFTDSTLFSLNRYGGYDRFDGGTRVNYGLRGAWNFPGGQVLDGLIGQSWQEHIDQNLYPEFQPWNGFARGNHLSDVVARVGFAPNSWLDFVARGRIDHSNGDIRFADAIASFGKPILRFGLGYVFSPTDPYNLYATNPYALPGGFTPATAPGFFTPRSELAGSVSSHYGHYTLSVNARRDLQTHSMVSLGADAKYEDECFIFDILAARRYTSINLDQGDTTILFTLTFKTVGSFGFNG